MSLDYPDYLRIRARSRWLGIVWRIGDTGYYVFLLAALLVPMVFAAAARSLVPSQRGLIHLLAFLVVCAVGFRISCRLKHYAHLKGGTFEQDGNAEQGHPRDAKGTRA